MVPRDPHPSAQDLRQCHVTRQGGIEVALGWPELPWWVQCLLRGPLNVGEGGRGHTGEMTL